MTRIKLVLGLAAVVVALIAASAVPALADDNGDRLDDFFRHDGIFLFDNGFDHFDRNNLADFEIDQDIDETGDVDLSTTVTGSGDNSNQCVAPLQFGNTGNLQNAQGFTTFGSPFFNGNDNNNDNNRFFHHKFLPFFDGFFNTGFDDVEFEGSTFEFNPTLTNTCDQSVEQAAAAGN